MLVNFLIKNKSKKPLNNVNIKVFLFNIHTEQSKPRINLLVFHLIVPNMIKFL